MKERNQTTRERSTIFLKTSLVALFLGLSSVVFSLVLGNSAFKSSITEFEEQYRKVYLHEAKTLAEIARLDGSKDAETLLGELQRIFESTVTKPEDEYLCIVDRNANLIVHTAHPDTIGNYAGKNPIFGETDFPEKCLADLVSSKKDYVGDYVSSSGQSQLAAFAAVPDRQWVVGIHRSKQALIDHIEEGIKYSKTGFYIVCGALMPVSLFMIFLTFNYAERKRRRTEDALAASERKWRQVLVNTPQIGISLDRDARIVFANGHFLTLTGWKEDEVIGRDWFDLCIPESIREEIRNVFITVMNREDMSGLSTYENDILTKAGELRRVAWSNVLTKNVDGNVVDVTCLGIDITERQKVFEEIKSTNEKMRLAADSAHFGIWDLDVKADRLEWDSWMFRLYGIRRENFSGAYESWQAGVHPDDLERSSREVEQALSGEKEFDTEFRIVRPNGEMRYLKAYATVLRDSTGDPIRMIGVNYDITDRRLGEDALRESKAFLDNMTDVAYTADDQGNVLWVNPAIKQVTGLSPEAVIGRPFLPLFVEADHASLIDVYQRTLAGESLENTLTFQSGVTCHFTSMPKRSQQGAIVGTFGVARDISERLAAERALQTSEARLIKAQAMARVGNWEYDIVTGKVWGSEEAFRIYGIERTSEFLPLDKVEDHIVDAQSVNQALVALITKNQPYDIEFQISPENRAGLIHVHSMADLVCDRDGRPVKVVGVIQDITDYRRLQKEIRHSEETYRNLLNNLNAGVVVHAPDTSIRIANPSACQLLGLSVDQMMGKEAVDPYWKFLRDDGSDMPLDEYPVNRVLSAANPLHNLVVGVKRSAQGDVVWLLVNGFATINTSNQIEQVIINFVDITERKKAEEALRQRERDLRESQKIALLGSWRLDLATNQVEWTEELYRMYGFDPTIPPPPYTEHMKLFTPESWELLSTSLAKTAETGIPYELELETVKDDGSNGWMWVRGETVRNATDQIVGLWGAAQDITERKLVEKALKESEERFKALHNASFGGIAIHDKGLVLECNKGLTEITGYAYEELIGMNGLDLISDDTRDRVIKNIETGYEKPYEATGVRKNGERYPMRLESRNIPYKGKNVRVVEFRDISAAKRAEKERAELEGKLRQAQKMEAVGRLAGGVAHDFNNMLSVIIGQAGLALEDVDPSQPMYARLEEIRRAGERSADLTRQLLAFARKQTVSPRVLDLNQTVGSMTRMLKRLLGEDIDLAWRPGGEVWGVKIDPSQIDQILANLCVNSRDAITDVGKITIETGNAAFDEAYCSDHPGFIPGEYVLLAVSDNGCGMDAETLENIFEPFFTTKASGQGTGLGLATVYGVVKQNNGFINVYSEPRQGTTFRIYLPREQIHSNQLPEKVKDQPTEHGHETILLVEDEIAILRMTTQMLARLGYHVLEARTPGEAIGLAREHAGEIHLLVTDVVMPEMNGRDLAKNILSLYPRLRRLFMSGYTANVIAHHGVLEEDVNFIQKPFSREQLGAKVREALDKGIL